MSLGLSLAGGGVKGIAHVGVLRALEEANIKIDYIAGTSSGSIIATLYAIGYHPNEIYQVFFKYSKKIKYWDWINLLKIIYGLLIKRKIIIKGFNDGKILEKLIINECNNKNIKNINQIKMPIIIPSVDLHSGEIYAFTSVQKRTRFSDHIKYISDSPIEIVVRASASYPGVFCPVNYNNTELIDGGIRENIPWKLTKEIGADKVISVVFENEINANCCDNIIDVVSNSLKIMSHELSNYELEGVEYILKIKTPDCGLLDMSKINLLYKLGYEQTKKEINNIKKIIYKTP